MGELQRLQGSGWGTRRYPGQRAAHLPGRTESHTGQVVQCRLVHRVVTVYTRRKICRGSGRSQIKNEQQFRDMAK